MDLEDKVFSLDVVARRAPVEPGYDVDSYVRSFREGLWDGLDEKGLRIQMQGQATKDFWVRARIVRLDPGSRWARYWLGPLTGTLGGAAVCEARVEVGDGPSVWGEVDAEGKRRMTLLGPNDDSVKMLADAARLAGRHAASKIIPILKSH